MCSRFKYAHGSRVACHTGLLKARKEEVALLRAWLMEWR